jgi:hypothetical protein
MPKPINVNPKNYKVKSILFDNGNFSVAISTWKNMSNTLAMRWSGNDKEDRGYPKAFGHPMWFIIHNDLKQPIILALMQDDKNIINKLLDN